MATRLARIVAGACRENYSKTISLSPAGSFSPGRITINNLLSSSIDCLSASSMFYAALSMG